MRLGLLNGIKAAGADKIVDAFAKGRVRGDTGLLSGVDVTQPRWIGISQGKPYIVFASPPNVQFRFKLDGDGITIVEKVQVYE